MNQCIDVEVRTFVFATLPLITSVFFKKIEVDDEDSLQDIYQPEDIDDLMTQYFTRFNVLPESFSLDNYFPWKSRRMFTRKIVDFNKQKLTVKMLIASAKAGRWLYG